MGDHLMPAIEGRIKDMGRASVKQVDTQYVLALYNFQMMSSAIHILQIRRDPTMARIKSLQSNHRYIIYRWHEARRYLKGLSFQLEVRPFVSCLLVDIPTYGSSSFLLLIIYSHVPPTLLDIYCCVASGVTSRSICMLPLKFILRRQLQLVDKRC